MIFVKLKGPSQLMYHWCGEGAEACMNVAIPLDDEEAPSAVVYIPKQVLEDQDMYADCKARDLIISEFEGEIEDVIELCDELGFGEMTH